MNQDLTVGKPETVLWQFCLPLFGSIIFQQLYNIADSLIAGKFIGETALASVGNSYEVTLIFIAFAFGCNIGCSVIVSQLFGAKEYGRMKTAVSTACIASAVLCAATCSMSTSDAALPRRSSVRADTGLQTGSSPRLALTPLRVCAYLKASSKFPWSRLSTSPA